MSTETRVCTNCLFCVQKDHGYSNYTVEGTTGACLFGLVPEFEATDYEYASAEEKRQLDAMHEIAKSCPHFTAGTGLYYDCDGEDEERNRAAWIAQYVKTPPSEECLQEKKP